jgi:hypothetical protein
VWSFGELDRFAETVSLARGGDEAFDSEIGGASQFSVSDRRREEVLFKVTSLGLVFLTYHEDEEHTGNSWKKVW